MIPLYSILGGSQKTDFNERIRGSIRTCSNSPRGKGREKGIPVPCPLFRRVQKRDATIVDFSPEKITEAIFKAAVAVGGKTANEVRGPLPVRDPRPFRTSSGFTTNLLHIEQIQDSIERILMEHGHYRTSRAFITYRNERTRRRAMKGEEVPPAALRSGNSIPCMKPPSGLLRVSGFDGIASRSLRRLVRETNLSYDDARKVSYAVEMEIIHSKISHLTAPLIRELTNVHLLQMGFEAERRLHSRLGLPVYDVEQQLLRIMIGSGEWARAIERKSFDSSPWRKSYLSPFPKPTAGPTSMFMTLIRSITSSNRVRDLDLRTTLIAMISQRFLHLEETEWDRFLHSWEGEEKPSRGQCWVRDWSGTMSTPLSRSMPKPQVWKSRMQSTQVLEEDLSKESFRTR